MLRWISRKGQTIRLVESNKHKHEAKSGRSLRDLSDLFLIDTFKSDQSSSDSKRVVARQDRTIDADRLNRSRSG